MRSLLTAALLCVAALASAAGPSAQAKRDLAAANRLYHKLDLAAASARFDTALEAFPGWRTGAGFRAACRWTLGDLAGAAEDAKVAATLRPNDAFSFAARGKARLVLKDFPGALADFRRSSAEDARSVEGPLGEGSVLSAMGKPREALAALDAALKLDPGSAAALLMRGSVKDRLRDFRGAAADFGSILELNPNFAWARYYRGKALRELKDYRGAEGEFTTFLETNEDHEDTFYLRSNVRFLLGDYPGVIADLTKVIALNPRKGLAYSNRGQTRALVGDKTGAVADLRKALELDPQRRAKITAAIDAIEADEEPVAEEAEELDARDPATAAPPRRAPARERDAPSFGDDGPGVSIERDGKEAPPRRVRAPVDDLDEVSAKPESKDAAPARRPRREPPELRNSGEEEPLFIDR